MNNNIEGLVFGDFSALESEERAKIDHVLRDGSNAVELYWSFQENGLPVSALPNGPSSLTPEERDRIEQQKLQDIASSLQNLQDFGDSSVASAAHYSSTELSLTPENNFVFRADTPPTGKETSKTGQQQVPEGAVQIGWENRPGPSSLVGNSGEQLQSHFGSQQNVTGEKYAHFVTQPQMLSVQQESYAGSQFHQGGQYQLSLGAQQIQSNQPETCGSSENFNRPGDIDGSNAANNASQKKIKRNKKKRPPNYYENLEKENASTDTSEIASPPELEAESAGGAQQTNSVNNVPPPVNMIPQQNLSQNVPVQNVPPEMVTQIIHANQLMAAASMDPQFAQQQHQQQQQMARTVVNALIRQGTLFPMQVLPPYHMIGQMPPGMVPMQQDTRIPPPNVEGPLEEAQPKYPPSMLQSEHSQQKRHSVERQFQPHQHRPDNDREFTNNDKPPHNTGFANVREVKCNQEKNLQNHGHEQYVHPSPPKQVLPPSDNVKYDPSPNVPKTQEQQGAVEQEVFAKDDSDFEAQKQLQESIEKVTHQALQQNESIRKLLKPEQPKEALRTEECNRKVPADTKVLQWNQNQSEQCPPLPSETQDTTSRVKESRGPESAAKDEANRAPEVPPGELVLTKGNETIPESPKDTEPIDTGKSAGASVVESQQTNTAATKGATSEPQASNNPMAPSKPAGAWGSKPGGAWADLFKNTETAAKSVVIYADGQQVNSTETAKTAVEADDTAKEGTPEKPVPAAKDKAAKQLGDILLKHDVSHRPYPLQPRGLVNRGNWCYVNATLQALLACPPFYHLMKALPSFPPLSRGPTSTPVIDSLIEFICEFGPMQPRNDKSDPKGKQSTKLSSRDLQPGTPFEPTGVYKMLHLMKYDAEFKHGRQEDAEEFLTCVLNGLHDEMVAAVNVVTGKVEEPEIKANGEVEASAEEGQEDADADDQQWEKVGPKNKSVITRSAKISQSPIAKIFGGQLRSILHQQGSKESATLEPFFTLQLDVHNPNVWDVKQALDSLVSKESLQGYTCAKTKVEVEATRRILLEELPPVLILHLKWFIYNKSGGLQKHPKNFGFEEKLELSKDLLSQNARARYHVNQRTYKLFAVVNHHGARAIGGHYTAFVYHPGIHGWVHLDDSTVKTVNLSQALKLDHPRVPYLLYYRRVDVTS